MVISCTGSFKGYCNLLEILGVSVVWVLLEHRPSSVLDTSLEDPFQNWFNANRDDVYNLSHGNGTIKNSTLLIICMFFHGSRVTQYFLITIVNHCRQLVCFSFLIWTERRKYGMVTKWSYQQCSGWMAITWWWRLQCSSCSLGKI